MYSVLTDLRADLLAALPASHAAVVRDAVTCARVTHHQWLS